MKIYYIAPIAAATTKEMGWVEEQIVSALQNTFVIPFQTWMNETWIKFIDASFIFCLTVAFIGAICGMIGIKRGYKVSTISIIFFFLLRLFSWGMGWY